MKGGQPGSHGSETDAEWALEHEVCPAPGNGDIPGVAFGYISAPDRRSGFFRASEGAATVLGYDPRSLTGRTGQNYLAIVHDDDRERLLHTVSRAVARLKPYQVRYRARSASGTVHWLWEKGEPRLDPKLGRVVAVQGRVFDVTDLVGDLQREAESAQHVVMWQCLQGVARHLRSRLGEGLGPSRPNGLAERGGANRELLLQGESRTTASTGELGDLVALANDREPRHDTVDLNATVRSVVSRLKASPAYVGSPRLILAESLPHVSGDAQLLSDAISTLARRAIRAVGSFCDVQFTTDAIECDAQAGGTWATLEVRDGGRQQPTPSTLQSLFAPCADDGTGVRDFKMAEARYVVHSMGGWLKVFAVPPQGLAIKLYFAVDAAQVAPPRSSLVRQRRAGPGSRGLVLVVDDTPLVRRAAAMTLQRAGFQVLSASSGPQALAMVDSARGAVDVLVTDVIMPGEGGIQLAEAIRRRAPHVRVLYVSGYPSDVALTEPSLTEQGAFLQKPFAPGALAEAVSRLVLAARQSR